MCEIFLESGNANTLTAKLDGFERITARRKRQPAVTEASCGMLLETSENTQKRLSGGGGFSRRFPVGFTNEGSNNPPGAVSGTEGVAAPELAHPQQSSQDSEDPPPRLSVIVAASSPLVIWLKQSRINTP